MTTIKDLEQQLSDFKEQLEELKAEQPKPTEQPKVAPDGRVLEVPEG